MSKMICNKCNSFFSNTSGTCPYCYSPLVPVSDIKGTFSEQLILRIKEIPEDCSAVHYLMAGDFILALAGVNISSTKKLKKLKYQIEKDGKQKAVIIVYRLGKKTELEIPINAGEFGLLLGLTEKNLEMVHGLILDKQIDRRKYAENTYKTGGHLDLLRNSVGEAVVTNYGPAAILRIDDTGIKLYLHDNVLCFPIYSINFVAENAMGKAKYLSLRNDVSQTPSQNNKSALLFGVGVSFDL